MTIQIDFDQNTFACIIFGDKTIEEKTAASASALTFNDGQLQENRKHLYELGLFLDYLKSERLRMAQDLIELADPDAPLEIKKWFNEVNTVVTEYQDCLRKTANGTAQDADRKNLIKASRDFVRLSEKFSSDVLPRLTEEEDHIDSLSQANRGLAGIYGVVHEALSRAVAESSASEPHKDVCKAHISALGVNMIDVQLVQETLKKEAANLRTMEDNNRQQTAGARKLTGDITANVSSALGAVLIAAEDFNNAGAAAPALQEQGTVVLPTEVHDAITAVKNARKRTQGRPAAGPQA